MKDVHTKMKRYCQWSLVVVYASTEVAVMSRTQHVSKEEENKEIQACEHTNARACMLHQGRRTQCHVERGRREAVSK